MGDDDAKSPKLDVKSAVNAAKGFVASVLGDEDVSNIGLEEIEYGNGLWHVTIGFSRPWNATKNALFSVTGEPAVRRTFRVVTIKDDDGKILSMMQRDKGE